MTFRTADLVDEHGEDLRVCDLPLYQYGDRSTFSGRVRTVSCHEDNALVKQLLNTEGDGCVLVVNGHGSLRTALTGDLIATAAVHNGWAGLIINGAVRDSATLAQLPLGIKALGTTPRKSAKHGAGDVDVPVSFGDVTFHPGDELVADDDGVVLLPQP